ncbi:calcium/proton exchanger [Alicyclobacillus shizuokensis]|uniref:calcium/proton exchanger n=1 Tax=Alicyclobacillus shizuokensis TaxID=392014 RepID=UPI00082BE472|nr:calcium/proton exchanger [Alicyclobacillus shizuokensis]MCL6625649.1 calcium/proton exchanger [Alicyclobacillus shizuokensis]
MNKWIWPVTAVLVGASAVVHYVHAAAIWVFLLSCLSIIPLAGIMGRSTESIAAHAGPRLGGLLSATFGNAVELIIGVMAIKDGLVDLVKASITGSILGNLLFVLGVSFFVGGIRHPIQRFNIRAARSNSSMLVASIGVAYIVPAIFATGTRGSHILLSSVVAATLFVLYIGGLYFSLITHRDLFESINTVAANSEEDEPWRLWPAVLILFLTTILVSFESEWLVDTVKEVGHTFGWSELFLGVIVVAIVGNAAEHASAVLMAWKNRMDLSLEIAVGSSLQVAMFVAPVLFAASLLLGHPMYLVFSWPELACLGAGALLIAILMMDGESNWLEGALALSAYVIMAVGFYSLPSP